METNLCELDSAHNCSKVELVTSLSVSSANLG